MAQLKQGQTPEKLAQSMAFGLVLSCCPLLGATTALGLAAGIVFSLNHPALQLANYAAYPLQLALMIPFFRAGERLFGAAPVPLSVDRVVALFRADYGAAVKVYGLLALRGTLVWLALAPALIYVLSRVLRPLVDRLKRGIIPA